ncbi:MAG: hypothetical protein R3D46_09270 [Defluviimonas denitrificans]
MREGYDAPPLNPIPGVVWLILLPIVAMELVVSAGTLGLAGGATGVGWRQRRCSALPCHRRCWTR